MEKLRGETVPGLPEFEVGPVAAAQAAVRAAVREGTVRTAVDISDGGAATARVVRSGPRILGVGRLAGEKGEDEQHA